MSNPGHLEAHYGGSVVALERALRQGDETSFFAALDEVIKIREPSLLRELRGLTSSLQTALDRFRLDPRLVDLAEKEIPDARQRLCRVLELTDQAAHRTLDLVEQSCPPTERTAREATALGELWTRYRDNRLGETETGTLLARMDGFLQTARADSELVRHNLAEVLLAQGYQDLTGQIIRNVMGLVTELEMALVELARLSDGPLSANALDTSSRPLPAMSSMGPAVPGVGDASNVVNGQQDVDALLSGLGM